MRLLALSVGNTSLFGSVFTGEKPGAIFRIPLPQSTTAQRVVSSPLPSFNRAQPAAGGLSDLRFVCGSVDGAVLCSVVPALTAKITRAIETKFGRTPLVLSAGSPHGLRINYVRPLTLGADRVASALGARARFPHRHTIVVDCGTATTVTALHRDGIVLGGAILPGLSLWSEMLAARTAQLPALALRRPRTALGRSTQAGIAAGIFHGHTGAIRELVARVRREAFGNARVVIIGTGGHAGRFTAEKLFDALEPALVLDGLRAFAEQASAASLPPYDRHR